MAEKKSHKKLTTEELMVREQTAIQEGFDENSMFIAHSLAGLSAPPVDLLDTEAVERRTMDYIMDCQRTGTRVTPPGLALWLGITSKDLSDWLNDIGTDEHRKTSNRIYQFLHAAFADYSISGKVPAQVSLYLLKNWFGYTDSSRVDTSQTIEKKKSLEELAKEAESLADFTIIETQKGKKK